jgi:hypothetical protein
MMVEWLAKYRLSADDEQSYDDCESDYVGKVFSIDDFGIQSDLIAKKEIYSMQNKKFKNVHPVASKRLVEEFDPQ